MPVQLIHDSRGWSGYQARYGPCKALRTAYFSVDRYGAEEAERLANEALRKFSAEIPAVERPRQKPNPIEGMRAQYRAHSPHTLPRLHIVAWGPSRDGKVKGTAYSAEKHGVLESVRLAMTWREKATGRSYDMTSREVWHVLRKSLPIAPHA
jgi:hypothetical protein